MYDEAVKELGKRFPGAEFRNAFYMDRESVRQAVEELLARGCQTIVYQSINCPLYSDFEDYGYALTLVHELVNGRARIIMADQLGNQASYREAYCQILRNQLQALPRSAKVLVILSRHGHPFKKETQDLRAHLYREPLEAGIRTVMSTWEGEWNLVWSSDEYADEYWDPKHKKFGTHDAYHLAINNGYDYAIELPTEFPAENTDLMIFHAMKKFSAFPEYDYNAPVSYPNWEEPLVRAFSEGKTTGIYAGCPVGPYRRYVVDSVVASISDVLK